MFKSERTERPPYESSQKSKRPTSMVTKELETIDYKDIENLKLFITERGKVLPRRITGVSFRFQNQIKNAVKKARHMALLPFVSEE